MIADFPTAAPAYGLKGPPATVTVEKSLHPSHPEILTLLVFGIQLGKRHLAVGIHQGLLVDPAHALQGAHLGGVLRPAVARMLALELSMGIPLRLGLRQHQALLGRFRLQGLQALLQGLQVVPQPDAAHPRR